MHDRALTTDGHDYDCNALQARYAEMRRSHTEADRAYWAAFHQAAIDKRDEMERERVAEAMRNMEAEVADA